MGAKTALLAFADGDLRPALLGATPSDRDEAEAVVREIFSGYDVTSVGATTLGATYPPDDITHVTVLPGGELLCDGRLVLDRPSELPEHLLRVGAGRRIVMHGMHSVVDWLCFAVWEDGKLVRSLSLSPAGGIEENIGEPFDFERPYWDGRHPVEPDPAWGDQDPYPLPFHRTIACLRRTSMTTIPVTVPVAIRQVRAGLTVAEGHQLVAPNVLRSQALSLIYRETRRGELIEADARELLHGITTMRIRLLGDRVSRSVAWRVAQQLDWDDTVAAEYVAVAQLQADALVTLDADLARLVGDVVTLAPFEALLT